MGGCGSSKPKTYACSNAAMKFASQSFSASATVTARVTINGTTKTYDFGGEGVTLGVKVDFVKLNVREDTSAKVTVNGTTADVKIKAFVSIEKKLLAFDLGATVDGQQFSKCAYLDLAKVKNFPNAGELRLLLAYAEQTLANKMKCTTNDGSYDHFVTRPWMATSPPNASAHGSITTLATVKLSSDFMLHSVVSETNLSTSAVDVDGTIVPAEHSYEKIEFAVQGDHASPTGPSDDDLKYDSWGTCTELTPPKKLENMKLFFEASRSAALHKMFPGLKVRFLDSPHLPSALLMRVIDDHLQKQSQPVSVVV